MSGGGRALSSQEGREKVTVWEKAFVMDIAGYMLTGTARNGIRGEAGRDYPLLPLMIWFTTLKRSAVWMGLAI